MKISMLIAAVCATATVTLLSACGTKRPNATTTQSETPGRQKTLNASLVIGSNGAAQSSSGEVSIRPAPLRGFDSSVAEIEPKSSFDITQRYAGWSSKAISASLRELPKNVNAWTGTGPYHREIAPPGYSYLSADITLPCDDAWMHEPDYEIPYVYIGGWGAGNNGSAYDAGFQYSNTLHNYALIVVGTDLLGKHVQASATPRFRCGSKPIHIEFYARDEKTLYIHAIGNTDENPSRLLDVHVAFLHIDNGWHPNGGGSHNGIILKRMTSIGQDGLGAKALHDGSYFGHTSGAPGVPLVKWENVLIGRIGPKGTPVGVTPWVSVKAASIVALRYPPEEGYIVSKCVNGCRTEYDMIDNLKR